VQLANNALRTNQKDSNRKLGSSLNIQEHHQDVIYTKHRILPGTTQIAYNLSNLILQLFKTLTDFRGQGASQYDTSLARSASARHCGCLSLNNNKFKISTAVIQSKVFIYHCNKPWYQKLYFMCSGGPKYYQLVIQYICLKGFDKVTKKAWQGLILQQQWLQSRIWQI